MKPLKLAFIGGGINSAVGRVHASAAVMDGRFTIDAGCFSRDSAINLKTAERIGVSSRRTYSTPEEMLKHEADSIDALVILTPTPDHQLHVGLAHEYGCNVICEKALGVSSAESLAMTLGCRVASTALFVCFNYSAYPMVRELRARVQSGSIGLVHALEVRMPSEGFLRRSPSGAPPQVQDWRTTDQSIPTVSLDLGVHVLHLARFVLDLHMEAVVGRQSHHGLVSEVVDAVDGLASYGSRNVDAALAWGKSFLGIRNGLELSVFGDEGSLHWYQERPEVLNVARSGGTLVRLDSGSPGLLAASDSRYNRFKPGHPTGFIEAFANLYTDFADSLASGSPSTDNWGPTVFGGVEATLGLLELEAIHESSRTRSWISPAECPPIRGE